jgi:integrase
VARKRGNGEGSITRRRDGLYMARYTVQTPTGPKRKTIYGKTRQNVSEKLNKALADRDGGLIFDVENLTVSEYLDRWLRDSAQGTVRASTYKSYGQQVRRYLKPSLGQMKLRKLSPMHVQGLCREMQDRGLSARTVQYAHAVLHRSLEQATRWGMVGRNVAEDVDLPQVKREEIRPLNRDQTRALLKAAEGHRLEALYIVAVHTGMRPGEMLALKWDDVDLDFGALQLNRALSDGEFTAPKTARSRRRIKLTTGSVKALRCHRKRQLEERMQRAGLWQDQGLVFPSTVGTPLNHRNLVRSFKALLKCAGLPPTVRLYDLRHTCATLLLTRNVHPKYVQELLGHASIVLTLDTYSHVIPGMDGGTASAIEDALG